MTQDEGYINTMREAADNTLRAAVEAYEFNLVAALGLVPYPDGTAWCVLWGPNLQEGIAGFGDTPWRAVVDFNRAVAGVYKETKDE